MEFLCISLALACAHAYNRSSRLSHRIGNCTVRTRHLHCKHLLSSASTASDVLPRDATPVITILCSLEPCGPGYYLRHYENKQTDSSYKGTEKHVLCFRGNGCHLEPQTHEHWTRKTLKTDNDLPAVCQSC